MLVATGAGAQSAGAQSAGAQSAGAQSAGAQSAGTMVVPANMVPDELRPENNRPPAADGTPAVDTQDLHPRRGEVRVRVGIGGGGMGGSLGTSGGGGVLLGLDLGVQAGDYFAVYATARVATLLLLNYAHIGLMFEVTPVRYVSIGTGVAALGTLGVSLASSGGSSGASWGLPIVLGFNFGRRQAYGGRSVFRLGLEGDVGVSGRGGGAGGLMFAYTLM
ncbi:MAG: hypothetical protein Q8Q09_24935 [Deltaproteobacteria bacterium]|nr:hypothetical protein [Deltaproteobacteria bacterium]